MKCSHYLCNLSIMLSSRTVSYSFCSSVMPSIGFCLGASTQPVTGFTLSSTCLYSSVSESSESE